MARQRFTRHTQPVPCTSCGKLTTGIDGTNLCRKCFDAAGLENEHSDGYHDDAPDPNCPYCQQESGGAMKTNPRRDDYLVRRQRDRYYLYAFDAWTDDVGTLLGSAKGYDDKGQALHAAQRDAVRSDIGDAVVSYEQPDGSFVQMGNVGHKFRAGSYQSNAAEYWVWALGCDKQPLTTEGPWGPYDYQGARSYARISATNGTHDRAVSHGKDPSSESFEIMRVYRAGTGEHKYGVAQRIGAPMAANVRRSAVQYSGQEFDEIQQLATQLTDEDRQVGREAPRHGYSEENFQRAQRTVRAERIGAPKRMQT